MMKKNLLLILMCFVCGLVYAHDGLNFRNLDVKSGISDNYVRSVLRNRYGFMWFATLNGLNRYDGYQFKKYTTTQLGAYNNDIESIAEDAAGNIWIKGPVSYYIYDREQDKLENKIQPILNNVWALGPRPKRDSSNRSEAEAEQALEERFSHSQKILNLRKKYYIEYSKFLTPKQIEQVYKLEKEIMDRLYYRSQKRKNHQK